MNDKLTDINFILDQSTSMGIIKASTISGFNEFLKSQQEAEGDANFTLVTFDSHYQVVYSAKNVKEVEALNNNTFTPRGMTALLDAIGATIDATGQRLSALSEADRPAKVIFVILTDGEENMSREYTKEKISTMIKHQTETYAWDFVFLAANQDAIQAGSNLGFQAGNSMTFAANANGNSRAYDSISSKMTMYRSCSVETKCAGGFFDDADRDAQAQAGA
jgi:uncharacterized protein YegL